SPSHRYYVDFLGKMGPWHGSRRRQSAGHELDAGNIEPSYGAFRGGLEILRQPAVAVQPRDGSLDHPPPGQQDKALGGVRSLDNLNAPGSHLGEGIPQLLPGIGGVGKDMAQPGKRAADALQQEGRAITVLHVRRMHDHADRQAYRVGKDMALTTFDHLFSGIA